MKAYTLISAQALVFGPTEDVEIDKPAKVKIKDQEVKIMLYPINSINKEDLFRRAVKALAGVFIGYERSREENGAEVTPEEVNKWIKDALHEGDL